jgi:hypothetical protein
MVQIAICHLLVGAVFGLRFRVLVLLPVTVASSLITTAIGLAMGHSLFTIVSHVAICSIALNAGYLFGSLSRFTVAATRTGRILPIGS